MYILKGITPSEIESIKGGNKNLLKGKLEKELEKWDNLLHLKDGDHRFTQGICCTLLDILELIK